MLKSLKLTDVILVDTCEIPFESGLNIITGETGAGKSAIMHALSAVLGARADTSLIRKGKETAVIEAVFDEVSVKREIHLDKPSKIWIDGKLATLGELQRLNLAELIGQGAYHELKSQAQQIKILDQFGNCDRMSFADAHLKVLELGDAPDENELCDIDALKLEEGEENTLLKELDRLSNSEELKETSQNLIMGLDQVCDQLGALNTLADAVDPCDNIKAALAELQDAHYHYSDLLNGFESDPERLKHVEERLSAINTVKRKYKCDFADLTLLSEELKTKKEEIEKAKALRDELAEELTLMRKKAAEHLSQKISASLQELNMPKALFTIDVAPAPLSITGKDHINFILAANPGESPAPLNTFASGGELSRILLALKLLINENIPTLIFDEIDSNIGGETAALIGRKLKKLGQKHQVICITHFPQVAKEADHHLQIVKEQIDGRTHTVIKKLTDSHQEILRMMGGKAFTKIL